MNGFPVKRISPEQASLASQSGTLLSGWSGPKYLAQGDSWFSYGAFPTFATTNLIDEMVLSEKTIVVDCAVPGQELAHMTDRTYDSQFLRLLRGPLSWKWDAILLSGGGNDLIDALRSPPDAEPARRILNPANAASGGGLDRYVSNAGWQVFSSHLATVLDHFLAERDAGQNANTPVVLHTYDIPTARPAPAAPGVGPWLMPALQAYGIPSADWDGLTDTLFEMLRRLWIELVREREARGLRLVDTVGTLIRADAGASGPSHDWENEIHPTVDGYAKLAQVWRPTLEALTWPRRG